MKKILFLSVALLVLTASFAASNVSEPFITKNPIEQPMVYIGHGIKIPVSELLTLTPKQYRKLTGHRLGLQKSIALKLMQKKIKNEKGKGAAGGGKSQLVAALLAFFLGALGIHRFYLGYTWQGIVQLLTLGGLGIWALIDFIRILTGDLQPKDGEYETTL